MATQTTFTVPAAYEAQVKAELEKVGTVKVARSADGKEVTMVVDVPSIAKRLTRAILAPVAVDGSGHKLMGRVDTGSAVEVKTVDESDPIEAMLAEVTGGDEKLYGGFKWELFEGFTVTEQIREKAAAGACDHCEVNRKDRRFMYVATDAAGKVYTLGSTCGIHKFGANLDEIFRKATSGIPKQVRHMLKEARERVVGIVDLAEGQQELVKKFGTNPLPVMEAVLAKHNADAFVLNIVEILRSYRKGDHRLSYWMDRKIRAEITAMNAPQLPAVQATEEEGEKVTAKVTVLNQKWEVGQYGGYFKTLTQRADGFKVWFRTSKKLNLGQTYTVTGAVSGTGTGIVFLKGKLNIQ